VKRIVIFQTNLSQLIAVLIGVTLIAFLHSDMMFFTGLFTSFASTICHIIGALTDDLKPG